MTTSDYLQPNAERVAAKVMDGEAVIIDLTTGTYYSLAGTGGRAWQLLEAGASIDNAVDTIAREYGIDRTRASDDMRALVSQLIDEQLVVPSPTPAGSQPGEALPAASVPAGEYHAPELQIYRDMQDLLALDPPMPGLQDIPWK